MKKTINIVVFGLLLLIFGSYMFTYQVRQDQVAFLSTFGGKPRTIKEPGPGFRLPWPFQKLEVFDKRVHLETTEYVEIASQGSGVMVQLYYGWKIDEPALFFKSHEGDGPKARVALARRDLESLILASLGDVLKKKEVDGASYFMPGADGAHAKLKKVEANILTGAKNQAKDKGVSLEFVGIRRLGLPGISLDRMLNAMVKDWKSTADGTRSNAFNVAYKIRDDALTASEKAVTEAKAEVVKAVNAAREDAKASFEIFKQDPALFEFLIQMDAMEKSVKPGATLILDETMGPFPLLRQLNKPLLSPDQNGTLQPPK